MHNKSKMADDRHIEKNHKSPYLGNGLTIATKFGLMTHFGRLYPSEGHIAGAVFLTKSPWSVKDTDMGAQKISKFGMRRYPVGFATTRHCLIFLVCVYFCVILSLGLLVPWCVSTFVVLVLISSVPT